MALSAWQLPPWSGAVSDDATRGILNGAGTAQSGQGRFAVHRLEVVADDGEQRGRDLRSGVSGCRQTRVGFSVQVL